MRNRTLWVRIRTIAVAGILAIALAGCGWFLSDGSLIVSIAELPPGVTSVTVTVTGNDMETVTGTYTGDPADSEPLVIPEGTGRRWTVVVRVSNDSPVTEYTAQGTENIVGGEITVVDAELLISGTKLVAMDEFGGRLVQVDDISGSGWTTFDDSSENWSFSGMVDLEIGPDARIYLTDQEMRQIHVVDTIAGESVNTVLPEPFDWDPGQLGIDHPNGLIYFSNLGTGLFSVPLAGGTPTDYSTVIAPEFSGGEVNDITGLTVSDAGIVYALCRVDDVVRVIALDPTGAGTVVGSQDLVTSWTVAGNYADVVAKGNRIVIILHDDATVGPVVELTSDLQIGASFGTLYDGESTFADTILGPYVFVGHRNPEIQFADMDEFNYEGNRLVELESILGAGFTTFGETGLGTNQFAFYAYPM